MIIVMGMPGVGKSAILSAITKYRIVNYGDLMLEIFRKKYGLKNRDEIRNSSLAQQKIVQKAVAVKLSKMGKKVILDTHCAIITPQGYLPGLPYELIKNLKVEKLVYISASADEIIDRRKNDLTRVRKASKDEIIEHEQMNRAYLACYSALTGAPATIVINKTGMLSHTVEQVRLLL